MTRRFVTFDYGQTLADLDTAMLAARCIERGAAADPDALEAALGDAWSVYDAAILRGEGGHPWRKFMRELLLRGAVAEDRVDDLVAFLWSQQPTRNLWRRPVPGMFELARDLAAEGVGVAIISNSEGRLVELLGEVGLADTFPITLDSGKLGVEKPDRRIFDLALEALGAKAGEVVHVGDSWAADVEGALGAGLAAVWFRGRTNATRPLDPARVLRADDAEMARAALRDLGVSFA